MILLLADHSFGHSWRSVLNKIQHEGQIPFTKIELLHNTDNTESVCCNSKSTRAFQSLHFPEELYFDKVTTIQFFMQTFRAYEAKQDSLYAQPRNWKLCEQS